MPAGVQRVPPNVRPFTAELEGIATQSVRASSRALTDAEAARDEARVALERAREAVSSARAADDEAALAAAREGKTPKSPTAAKAEARADNAQRGLEANEQLVREAIDKYAHQVLADLTEITTRAEAELRQVGLAAGNHLEAVEKALARRAEVTRLVQELDPDSLQGNEISFLPAWPGSRPRDPVPKAARDLLEGLRSELHAR